jgi:hypothetical protein
MRDMSQTVTVQTASDFASEQKTDCHNGHLDAGIISAAKCLDLRWIWSNKVKSGAISSNYFRSVSF